MTQSGHLAEARKEGLFGLAAGRPAPTGEPGQVNLKGNGL